MVLIALFATALFRMVESGHTHQAKIVNDRSLKFEASMTVFRCHFCGNCRLIKNGIETIRRLSGTPTKEVRLSYRSTFGTSKSEGSRFTLSGEF